MYRVVAHEYGPPGQALAYEPAGLPFLTLRSVLVRMRASTINPSDLISVTGAYRHRTAVPFVPGYDGVGVITELGFGIHSGWLGRRVLPLGSPGGWQSWKVVPTEWCIIVPDDISDAQAATAYINPLTARLMVQALNPQPGDRIGITAGASAIGRMLIRMLAAMKAHPVAIVRSQVSYAAIQREPAEVVREGAPLQKLDAGLDAVGGTLGSYLAAAISPGRPLLHYGLLSGQPLTDTGKAKLTLFRLRDWVHNHPRRTLHTEMAATFDAIRSGVAATEIAARYPLRSFHEALAHDAEPYRQGKIILDL